ncbi:MAG: transglycosylase domain-containing protein [Solirubrobacteraceae bacterium]|nr:transglycosylase domain-containing protein [Solirubrobacteraceae bacterium]
MSHASRKRRSRRAKGGAARVLIVLVVTVVVGMAIAGVAAYGVIVDIADDVDLDRLTPKQLGEPSVVYAKDGTRLGFIHGDILRQPVSSKEMSQSIRDATVAVEDRRFYQHSGVDLEGIFRAALRNFTTGETKEGASTLEMQLIRNLYTGDSDDSYKRKIREAKLADQLKETHPGREGKRWVLTTYLNSVPYGNARNGLEIIGVQAAARVYFDTTAEKLKLHEAAMIAGLPQAPTEYNPYLSPERALARRNDVLRRMAEQGYISPSQATAAQSRSLGLKESEYYTRRREQHFLDFIRKELTDIYGSRRVRQGGLRVHTTIDLKRQQQARAALAKNYVNGGPAGALVAMNPRTGDITTMASTVPYGESKFNLPAQGKRQPGSTFKIMVLMAALREGIDPDRTSYVSRSGQTLLPGWAPKTYSGSSGGSMNLVRATLASDNSVYAQLDLDVGPAKVTKAARDMGITSKLLSVGAEGLGGLTDGVTPLEMARAYSTIANGGRKMRVRSITKVEFPDGRVRHPQKIKGTRTFDAGVASKVTEILEKNVQGGTGRAASLGSCRAAGKTGTTDGEADAWFAGFTRGMVTISWIGYPTSRQATGEQGGGRPARTWGDFMRVAKGDSCGDFPKAPFVGTVGTGRYASGGGGGGGADDGYDADGTDDDGFGGDRYPPSDYESAPQNPPE